MKWSNVTFEVNFIFKTLIAIFLANAPRADVFLQKALIVVVLFQALNR